MERRPLLTVSGDKSLGSMTVFLGSVTVLHPLPAPPGLRPRPGVRVTSQMGRTFDGTNSRRWPVPSVSARRVTVCGAAVLGGPYATQDLSERQRLPLSAAVRGSANRPGSPDLAASSAGLWRYRSTPRVPQRLVKVDLSGRLCRGGPRHRRRDPMPCQAAFVRMQSKPRWCMHSRRMMIAAVASRP